MTAKSALWVPQTGDQMHSCVLHMFVFFMCGASTSRPCETCFS